MGKAEYYEQEGFDELVDYDDDFYRKDWNNLVEDDEINLIEAAFMKGWDED